MGCFNYCCSLKCTPGCHEKNAESGQDPHMMNVSCYAVNNGRKWKVHYEGHGYCSTTNSSDSYLYDLGHVSFFDIWDVKDDDMRAHLACPVCAASIVEEVGSYEELVRVDIDMSAEALAKRERAQANLAAAKKQVEELKRKRVRYVALIATLDEKLTKKQARIRMSAGNTQV